MGRTRDKFIDFLRGLAIIDMVLVHYASSFPPLIEKLVLYHDIAMEGFLALSGFMIGKHYLPQFMNRSSAVSARLLRRAWKITLIDWTMIITISLPMFLYSNRQSGFEAAAVFLLRSLTFSNQIGLIHILPTFIPLFLISPILLFLLSRGLDSALLILSTSLFIAGQINPYLFNYGDKTIFPVILWQIYFVFGAYLGKVSSIHKKDFSNRTYGVVMISLVFGTLAIYMRHSHTVQNHLTDQIIGKFLRVEKFPLNTGGLFYGVSLCFLVYSLASIVWGKIKQLAVVDLIALLGRHSLLAFVIHVYFAKLGEFLIYARHATRLTLCTIMAINLIFTYIFLLWYETRSVDNTNRITKIIRYLF